MDSLELKKLKVELLRVSAAKGELELRVHMAAEEIERLQGHIKVQEEKEAELQDKIKNFQEKK